MGDETEIGYAVPEHITIEDLLKPIEYGEPPVFLVAVPEDEIEGKE